MRDLLTETSMKLQLTGVTGYDKLRYYIYESQAFITFTRSTCTIIHATFFVFIPENGAITEQTTTWWWASACFTMLVFTACRITIALSRNQNWKYSKTYHSCYPGYYNIIKIKFNLETVLHLWHAKWLARLSLQKQSKHDFCAWRGQLCGKRSWAKFLSVTRWTLVWFDSITMVEFNQATRQNLLCLRE